MARPLPPGVEAPPPRRGPGWGWWALLLATLVGWAPVAVWAAGLLLADALGCRLGGSPSPCPSPVGDLGAALYGMAMAGGWLMIPAALLMIPTGLAWAGLFLAWTVRRLRGRA